MPIHNWPVPSQPFTWIDIVNPTEAELKEVSEKYNIHHYALKDCLQPDHLPKYEDLSNMNFIITRILIDSELENVHTIQQISSKVAIFYNHDFIVTVHRLPQAFLENIKTKYIDTERCKTTNELVTKIIWFVLHSYDSQAIQLSNDIDTYEAKIFLEPLTPAMMEDLYFIKRKASTCYKLLMLTREVINTIRTTENDLVALQDVKDLHIKLSTMYDQTREDITNLLNFYLSISSQKTNAVMKILTVFSVFFMPLTFIVGIYGMNFEFMPELKSKWGYPIVLLSMAVLTGIIFWWFKKRKWL